MVKIVPGSDGKPLNVLEYEEYAREYLPKNAYDYYASGADDMVSLRENRDAFKRLILRPRVMRDVSNMDTSTTLLGHRISSPVCVAPSAMHRMAHPDGEIGSTTAAAKADTCYILSTLSTTKLEVRGTCSQLSCQRGSINTVTLSWRDRMWPRRTGTVCAGTSSTSSRTEVRSGWYKGRESGVVADQRP
jgi:isopentenyl diphosphate isomerase/L-lactate dehydrogenase-like FMN-dependent dehydrogenase